MSTDFSAELSEPYLDKKGCSPCSFDVQLSLHPRSLIFSVSIQTMSQSTCYVGIAFYNHASFPTQWALILSENPSFMGPGWGSTAAETVNGAGTSSVSFERSPASFNPIGLFLGIVYVAHVPMSINNLKALISSSNQASAADRTLVQGTDDIPWGTDKYVVLALLRLYEGQYLRLPRLRRDSLAHFIAGRIRDLLRLRCTPGGDVYPIVSLESGAVSFGHSWR